MTIPNTTPAHDDFYDWLDQCPVQWFRQEITNEKEFGFGHVVYLFSLPDPETPD